MRHGSSSGIEGQRYVTQPVSGTDGGSVGSAIEHYLSEVFHINDQNTIFATKSIGNITVL